MAKLNFKSRMMNFFRKENDGATIVEFAVISILFFWLVIGSLAWALTMWTVNAMQYAVERQARCLILPTPLGGAAAKQCGQFPNNLAQLKIDWIPGIQAVNVLTCASGSGCTPTNRIVDGDDYNAYCVIARINNPFVPNYASIPAVLNRNYCRPAQ